VPAPYPMPAYRGELDNQQIAEVLTFVRGSWNNQGPAVTASEVGKLARATRAP
jgi:alcohol dehydrogenase (quinone), cytochrome c subunit